ncbi:MAG: DUF2889 domain-containing protein [Burkholderiaceae bacterium]
MSSRRHVHTRSIQVEAFVRDDGLWELEAVLIDTKSRDFSLATGVRPAGEPVHQMHLTLTIDSRLQVLDAWVRSARVPYPGYCDTIGDDYRQLIGLNLARDFRRQVRERLGGTRGCTHITELTDVLPTAAVQAFAGEVYPPSDTAVEPAAAGHAAVQSRPFQLDRCHALRIDGPAVARFYPRWFRDSAQKTASADPVTD